MRKPLDFADLEWDQHGHPRSKQFQDIYFSASDDPQRNGLAESRYVFLHHNQLESRWRSIASGEDARDSFVIGETGFGTGLNFLATWALWDQISLPNTHLHYISVEKYPLRPAQLAQALTIWPELESYSNQLLAQYPSLLAQGFFSLTFPNSKLHLTLIIEDAESGLQQCLQSRHPHFRLPFGDGVDAWYLDGFAPRLNPRMWSDCVLQTIAELSHAGTTVATFTAAGAVRRQLQCLGFSLNKFPGFAGKREMLCGHFQPPTIQPLPAINPKQEYPLPWSIPPRQHNNNKEAIIVGAGLAGCHTARELAERGWRVKIIDAADQIASGASGNNQGVVYAKLSADDDAAAQFNVSALLVAARVYQQWWQQDPQVGQQCGVLQLAGSEKHRRIWQQCRKVFGEINSAIPDGDVAFVAAAQAGNIAGISIEHDGMFFPRLGWLNPARLCRQLIDHPSIELRLNTEIGELDFQQDKKLWHLLDQNQHIVEQASTVIIANAHGATQFSPTKALPLKQIRGQVTYLSASESIDSLRIVICGDRYIAPRDINNDQLQTLGASFNLNQPDLTLRTEDHQHNLAGISSLLPALSPQLSGIDTASLSGRAQFRCTTPDYLPLVGPVHDHQQFLADFSRLRVNATTPHHQPGRHWPGLFINVGHGSRGLAYTPLCARLLVSLINGDPLPVSRALYQALHPGRFTLRGLIRGQL